MRGIRISLTEITARQGLWSWTDGQEEEKEEEEKVDEICGSGEDVKRVSITYKISKL